MLFFLSSLFKSLPLRSYSFERIPSWIRVVVLNYFLESNFTHDKRKDYFSFGALIRLRGFDFNWEFRFDAMLIVDK